MVSLMMTKTVTGENLRNKYIQFMYSIEVGV